MLIKNTVRRVVCKYLQNFSKLGVMEVQAGFSLV